MPVSESTDTSNTTPTSPNAAAPSASGAVPAAEGAPVHHDVPATDALATAKKEATDNYDRYLRAVADLENFRRRTAREKDELRQFAASRVLEDLLPVLD